MLNRWNPIINSINLSLSILHRLSQQVNWKRTKGSKPHRSIKVYALLIALKEFDERTLRGAEVHLSKLVCNERIDHSVIAYWENKPEMALLVAKFIAVAGAMLDKSLHSLFTFVDATKFANWKIEETFVTVCNRVAQETVYPIGVSFRKKTVASPVDEAVPSGSRIVYADAGYDDNATIGILFKKGYIPVICPNKNRWKGRYRKRARKIYNQPIHRLGYRQRGRGESLFGSLTNRHGDRLKATNIVAMRTRIASRILSYQIKLLIRTNNFYIVLLDTLTDRISF